MFLPSCRNYFRLPRLVQSSCSFLIGSQWNLGTRLKCCIVVIGKKSCWLLLRFQPIQQRERCRQHNNFTKHTYATQCVLFSHFLWLDVNQRQWRIQMTDSLTLNNISSVFDYIKETRLFNIRWLYWALLVGHENFKPWPPFQSQRLSNPSPSGMFFYCCFYCFCFITW